MTRFQYFGPSFILPITGENKWYKSIQSPRCLSYDMADHRRGFRGGILK